MTSKSRTQADRSAATRDALVTTARALFAAEGFAAVGTERIVRAAGVTRGALYHHFADKVELFAAVFEAAEADLTSRIDATVSSVGLDDPIELMRFGARTWLDACADAEVERILLVDAPAVLGWERWRAISLRYGMGLVQALVAHAIAVGRIAPQPAEPLAHILIGALDEAAWYAARADDRERARTEVGEALDRLIVALAVRPA